MIDREEARKYLNGFLGATRTLLQKVPSPVVREAAFFFIRHGLAPSSLRRLTITELGNGWYLLEVKRRGVVERFAITREEKELLDLLNSKISLRLRCSKVITRILKMTGVEDLSAVRRTIQYVFTPELVTGIATVTVERMKRLLEIGRNTYEATGGDMPDYLPRVYREGMELPPLYGRAIVTRGGGGKGIKRGRAFAVTVKRRELGRALVGRAPRRFFRAARGAYGEL